MVFLSLATVLLLALGSVSAHKCQDIVVSVSISAHNGNFNLITPATNIEVTNFILNAVQNGHNGTAEAFVGCQTISGDYKIQTTFCQPDKGAGSTVQLLTHGIGFDRRYWDIPYQSPEYSYIERAVDEYGYSTLAWDRLGVGMSQHGDPLKEIQAPLERAALEALTKMLRDGSIAGAPKFEKVVHVGHSFGSVLSFGLSRDMPELTDGLVLTGFSATAKFYPYFLLAGNWIDVSQSALASKYVSGYFAAGDASAVQTEFFAPMAFDPNILTFAFSNGQPVSVGELLTIAGAGTGVSQVTVPVLVITGQRDLPFCGGDCNHPETVPIDAANIPAGVQSVIPNAKPFEAVVVPGAGHGLNLELSHATTFKTINDFIARNIPASSSHAIGSGRHKVRRAW